LAESYWRSKETLDKLGYKDVVNLGALEDAANAMNLKIVKQLYGSEHMVLRSMTNAAEPTLLRRER
jgi:hypothetical protein